MARYDEVAATYAAWPDDYSGSAIRALLDAVGPVAGQRVLDLACGHGLVARQLARGGARVVGVDISERLLRAAVESEAATPLGIRYIHADAGGADLLSGDRFDQVVSNFGLSDIDDLPPVLRNVARLLRPGGTFTFSILHPCFPGVDRVSGSWPPHGTYYDEGWWRAGGELSTLRREVGANHRMISTYLNALVESGMHIDRIHEPPPEEVWARERPGAATLPVYLVVRTRRSP